MEELKSTEDFERALERSKQEPVFIFKHSTTCPVSAAAHQRFSKYLQGAADAAPPAYLVKVIESRPVSNEIASRLKVTHQSPQLILLGNGEALWNRSHGAIDSDAISDALGP